MLLCLALLSCSTPAQKLQLQAGDLLFQGKSTGKLSQAIDKVTQTSSETHFSHVGMVDFINNGEIYILHANPEGGTCRVGLSEFLNPKNDTVQTVLYRITEEWQPAIPQALKKAHDLLGLPYNFSYILSDSSSYCSEFIYRVFAADSIFTLNPMTFKDPATKEFFPTWVEYYQNLGLDIPEGLPGCNPNGMAASDKLECLGLIPE